MWKVEYTKRFLKDLATLPLEIQTRVEPIVFAELESENPFALGYIEKMTGYIDKYKIRVGDYRIGVAMKGKVDNMDWQDRIIINPEILAGKSVIKGIRLSIEFIVELLAQGWLEADILKNHLGITQEDIKACLSYASNALKTEKVYPLNV
ncbi:DUF433 domain-containing protein [Synechocystis sp. PCC 7509]|uniref:DUF433 domain-containing protein n=1 Tax=Synechocystis sp. PCC 7509 TaxID=927677 RepID=UPI0002AC1EF2|nr:DUF433 domain-containing protein [Synechocystis sp. PCC 7509]